MSRMLCLTRLVAVAGVATLLAGCYSWQLGSSDAGAPGDAAKREAGRRDASARDASRDAGAKADTSAAKPDAGVDAPPPPRDAGMDRAMEASCAALTGTVAEARAAAIACTLGSTECATSVTDACGCAVFVATPSGSATVTYASAVAALMRSGCPVCPGETCTPATTGLCLESRSEGGFVATCQP